MTHQLAISFSISFQQLINRAGGRTSNVLQEMKKLIQLASMTMIVVAVVGSLIVTGPFIDPPFTDQSMMLFLKGPDYLPSKNELTVSEIGPGLSRFLTEERSGYRTIFYLSCAGFAGIVGLVGSSMPEASRSRSSGPSSRDKTQEAESGPRE